MGFETKAFRVLIVAAVSAVCLGDSADATLATVYRSSNNTWTVEFGKRDSSSGAAWGSFQDGNSTKSNFGSLSLQSSDAEEDVNQMFAIGFLEGALTAERIFQEVENLKEVVLMHYGKLPSTDPKDFPKLIEFLDANDKWCREQVSQHPEDAFFRSLGLVLAQFDGLRAGYAAVAPQNESLSLFDFQLLNGVGDFFDLIPAVMPKLRRNFSELSNDEIESYIFQSGKCSALIKILGDYSNIFFSHTAWWSYNSMIRMMKHYRTPLKDEAVTSKDVSFSSYPGFLESLDDFYLMGNGLVMIQTTNAVFNQTLYDLVVPESVLAWQRVRVASLIATDAKDWHTRMATHNSGTYENQYMVLDLNKFSPGEPLVPDTLWVGEQIPGHYVATDTTVHLERGYWPSYNVPYQPEIYELSGYPEIVQKLGPDQSYDLAPRAKIFRRDQGSVVDMDSFKKIMRYNDFENDPYSEGSPMNAICSRGDLKTPPSAGGCVDCKVSDVAMAKKLQSEVVNGPSSTASSYGPGQKPFRWSDYPTLDNS